ncbi:MAG: hypothetical protein V3V08_12720 [Nannocystaceae bacterium]
MLWRILTAVATIGVTGLALAYPQLAPREWILPAAAGVCAATLGLARNRAWGPWTIGLALAMLAPQFAREAGLGYGGTRPSSLWPRYDLTDNPLPHDNARFVRIRGHLRAEWSIDEYHVSPGSRPDQNNTAARRLIPFLGTTEASVPLSGRIVVARVAGGHEHGDAVVELAGELRPLAPELLAALVRFDPRLKPVDISAVVLDTVDRATPGRVWTAFGLSAMTVIGAWILLTVATRSRAERPTTTRSERIPRHRATSSPRGFTPRN